MRALLVYPTHTNCAEVCAQALAIELNAAVYPGRLTGDDDFAEASNQSHRVEPNCWNAQANVAERMGFPVVKTVCPLCPHRLRCQTGGYLGQLAAVKEADIALCTHKRAEHSSLAELSTGRPYVSIHEHPLDLLRPRCSACQADLLLIQALLQRLLNEPASLDWFGQDSKVDDDGHRLHDAELALRRERLYRFCETLADTVDEILQQLESAERTAALPLAPPRKRPLGLERLLFQRARQWGLRFEGAPWPFVLAAAAGELRSAAILVRTSPRGTTKSAVGFRENPPAVGAVTWFNDATVRAETLRAVVGQPVRDITPAGHVRRLCKAVQIPRDVTRQTSPKIFRNLVRGVLADRPQFTRVGVMTHRPLVRALKALEPEFKQRIVKATYFASGEDRSSNAWHDTCDLILIAGTPRVPPTAIAEYLIQIGRIDAAVAEPVWGEVRWDGFTESGEPVTVRGRGYHDATWRRAYQDVVRAALVQAIGRGRGILEAGCEVVVLSNEECGLPLSDSGTEQFNDASSRVLGALKQLTMENSKKHFQGNSIVRTAEIASVVGLSVVRVREVLRGLERRGLVRKVGERGGWLGVEQASSDIEIQSPFEAQVIEKSMVPPRPLNL